MPRAAVKELTALQVNKLTTPGYHRVGGVSGLCLQVKKSGARSWVLRWTVVGRRQDFGLGGYPTVTLSMARERARRIMEEAWLGRDPRAERREALAAARQTRVAEAAMTFGEAWLAYRKQAPATKKKSQQEAQTLESRLSLYAFDVLENVKLPDITTSHIIKVLQPIWADKIHTATRLRAGIEQILNWATVHGYRTGENPARWKGHLDQVLGAPKQFKEDDSHKPSLPVAELPDFIDALRAKPDASARALEFLILTAVRSRNIRFATWSEFDLKGGIWTIRGSKMKNGKPLTIPLSEQALAILKATPRFAGTDLVFPGPKLNVMGESTMNELMKRMHKAEADAGLTRWKDAESGKDAVPHGFRSTFRNWAADRGDDHIMAEMALGHTPGDETVRAYLRTDMRELRRKLMQDWAEFGYGIR